MAVSRTAGIAPVVIYCMRTTRLSLFVTCEGIRETLLTSFFRYSSPRLWWQGSVCLSRAHGLGFLPPIISGFRSLPQCPMHSCMSVSPPSHSSLPRIMQWNWNAIRMTGSYSIRDGVAAHVRSLSRLEVSIAASAKRVFRARTITAFGS